MDLKIYYSIINGGDGSADPVFSLSEELAEIHQEINNFNGNGWAEPCMGFIVVQSESPIIFSDSRMINKESLLERLNDFIEDEDNENYEEALMLKLRLDKL